MSQSVRRFRNGAFLCLILAISSLSVRALQPPEILTASSPQSYVINGVGGQESGIIANATVSDTAGNTFVTGSFAGQATFGTNLLNSSGGYGFDDVYLIKYNAAGNVLWANRAGGSDKEFGRAIRLDGAGGVYVAGTSESFPATFGTNTFHAFGKTLFLARYDASGNCLWVKRGGGWQMPSGTLVPAPMTLNGLAVDSSGNPIVGGSFNGNAKFGGVITNSGSPWKITGGTTLSNRNVSDPASFEDIFIAKYAADGSLLWATNHGGTNTEFASSIAVDSTGAVYAGGGYKVTTTVGTQTYTNVSDGILLAKFSSNGDWVWSSNLSDSTNSNSGYGWSVAVDSTGRVGFGFEAKTVSPFRYAGNGFTNTVPGPIFNPVYMGLLAQFDSAGALQWLKRTPFNGSSASFPANPSTLAVDGGNNFFLGTASALMPDAFTYGTPGLGILKYNQSGSTIWTNFVPVRELGSFRLPSLSIDGSGIVRGVSTINGDKSTLLSFGWIAYYPFQAFGNNQMAFTIASTFVPVVPTFLLQPTNMVFQPPQGLSNSVLARAWPAPGYYWFMNGVRMTNATNSLLTISPTTTTNRTTYFVLASNAYGMTTSIVVNAQAGLAFAPLPPTNISVLIGTTLTIPAGATGTTAIAYQWRFNGTNIANATNPSLALPTIATNASGSYTLVISNATGSLTSSPPSVVTVLPYGATDQTWTNLSSSYLGGIVGLARASDGSFYVANGQNAAHVNSNGTLDTNFLNIIYSGGSLWYRWNDTSPSDINLGPTLIKPETDGKFIVAGTFKVFYPTTVTYTNVNRMVRLNTNGTLDGTFNVGLGATNTVDGQSFSRVESVIQLTNGQYLVGGMFNRFNGLLRTNLVRLNHDGSVDTSFPAHTSKYTAAGSSIGEIHTLALQADGKILVGGQFEVFDGVPNHCFTRLNADGTVDGSFTQTELPAPGFARVQTILPLADGKILIGGSWANLTNTGVLRFNSNGSRDTTWLGVMPGETFAISLLPSSKLVLGGNGFVRRTTFDGAADSTFTNSTFSGQQTYSIAQEPGGTLMVGGSPYGMRRLLMEPTPVTLPSFSGGVAYVDGQFQFSACGGTEGQSIVVQSSSNLAGWVNVSTNIVTGGCITYTSPTTPGATNQFFRLAILP